MKNSWKIIGSKESKETGEAKYTFDDYVLASLGYKSIPGITQEQAKTFVAAKHATPTAERDDDIALAVRLWPYLVREAEDDPVAMEALIQRAHKHRFPGSSATPGKPVAAPAGKIKKVYDPVTGTMK
jgi:hypothetical protein